MTMDHRDEAFFAQDGEPMLPEPNATEAQDAAVLLVLPQPEVG
jgi:hypothetical protein